MVALNTLYGTGISYDPNTGDPTWAYATEKTVAISPDESLIGTSGSQQVGLKYH